MFFISEFYSSESKTVLRTLWVLKFIIALLLIGGLSLEANPTNGKVANGSATITSVGNTLSITQTSQSAIINWQSFSISAGETTSFLQPSSNSAILNRVLGGSISNLDGTLSANGHVYLINQNGIVIGAGGIINTAGFMASTRDIMDNDFLSGNLHFTGNGNAGVTNLGKIAALGGDVILLGKTVENKGTITASGTAALVSADDVLLTQESNKGTVVVVQASATATADKTTTAVTNGGTVQATTAQLSAAQGNLFALAINNTGYVKARTLQHSGGHILLTSDSGTIQNSGTLDASADVVGGNGGNILVKSSNGTTWNTTTGQIVSQNGKGGKGGQIDTSGKKVILRGKVQAGKGGNWLIDPDDLTLDAAAASTIDSSLSGGTSVTAQTTATTASSPGTINPSGNGDIFVNSALSWTGSATLTLNSYRNITITAPISGTAGGLTLNSGGNITDTSNLNVSSFILQNGNWTQNANGGTLPLFSASSDFELQNSSTFLRVAGGNGSSVTPYLISDIYGLQGIGSPSSALLGTSAGFVYFKQTQNINASGTASWNGGQGFSPIGNGSTPFYGTYDGSNFTISGLTINRPSQSDVGLIGNSTSGTLINIGLLGGSVTGYDFVGELLGYSNNITIQKSYSTGNVSGVSYVGGLIGISYTGMVEFCYATGSVQASQNSVGGLAGVFDGGSLSTCYSSGNVAGTSTACGGLVGAEGSLGPVQNCYFLQEGNINQGLYGIGYISMGSPTNAGATPSTSAQLKNSSNFDSSWDFANTWTTFGNTMAPQLQSSPTVIHFSGSAATGDTVEVIANGTLIGSTTATAGTYDFFTTVQGLVDILVTELGSVTGNTYYKSGATLTLGTDITNLNLAANTLTIKGAATSTTQLKTIEGTLSNSTYGIDYNVGVNNNLSTSPGVSINLQSPFVLDGNLTATNGTITSASSAPLATSVGSVVLSANQINLASSLTSTGTVSFNSTGTITDTGSVTVGGFILQNGSWSQNANGGMLPGFTTVTDFEVQNSSTFLRVANGNGSTTPYEITDVYGLQGIAGFRGSNIVLDNNINAAVTLSWNSNSGFKSIGDSTTSYTGNFDGHGHTIDGLVVKSMGLDVGLFGAVNGSTIQNVGLTNELVNGTQNVGGLVGSMSGGTLLNCSTSGGSVQGSSMGVGGLVGSTQGTTVLFGSSSASVTGPNQTGGLIGGIYAGRIQNSHAIGNVNGTTTGVGIGGLIGYDISGQLVNCFATGNVAGASQVGGLVGNEINSAINLVSLVDTCYATGSVMGSGSDIGGLLGVNSGVVKNSYATANVTGCTTTGGLVGSNYDVIQDSFATGTIGGTSSVGGLAGYSGSQVLHCYATGSVTGTSYLGGLVGNNPGLIDGSQASGYVYGTTNFIGGLAGSNMGSVTNSFASGNVSGANGSTLVGGLVGGNYSYISTCSATGVVSGTTAVGGLVGGNKGEIDLADATGNVGGNLAVGGLVGGNIGSIEFSYASGMVSGNNWVGGLVGGNAGNIDLCFALGNVQGNQDVGGLVGVNATSVSSIPNVPVQGSALKIAGQTTITATGNGSGAGTSTGAGNVGEISNSFARGDVNGGTDVGGLVGSNLTGASIRTTYSTGQVAGSSHVGGLVGSNKMGSVSSSYWLQDPSLNTNQGLFGIGLDQVAGGATNLGATPETFANLQLASTYDSTWDFTPGSGIWGVNSVNPSTGELINDGLPFFQGQHPGYKPYIAPAILNPELANIIQQFIAAQVPTQGTLNLPGSAPIYFSTNPTTNTIVLSETPTSKTTGKGKEHENAIASGSSYKPADAHSGKRTTLVLPGAAVIAFVEGALPGVTLPPAVIQSSFKIILGPGVQQALEKALQNTTK